MTFDKRKYVKEYYEKHKEHLLVYHREYNKIWFQKNKRRIADKHRLHKEERNKMDLQRRKKVKIEALSHYSGGIPKCSFCGTTELVILCLDHINGGGRTERRKLGISGGVNFLSYLRSHNYPEGYQVLCYNCNARKTFSELPAFQP